MAGEKMSSLDKDTVLLLNKGKCGLFHLAFGRTAVIIVLLALQVALLFSAFFGWGSISRTAGPCCCPWWWR